MSTSRQIILWDSWLSVVFITLVHVRKLEMLETSLMPRHCICPNESYTCHVNLGIEIKWITSATNSEELEYSLTDTETTIDQFRFSDGFRVSFSNINATEDFDNFTSILFLTDLAANGTDITCKGAALKMRIAETTNDTLKICIIGSASAPTITSVVWDSVSAVVSFQPPVYGAECVDFYVVTAVSEERNVTCHAISDKLTQNCSIPPDSNVNDYNFTAYSVTRNDSVFYNGSIATDCCLPFPENVVAVEEECGLQQLVNVSWQSKHLTSLNTSISWRSVQKSSYDIHYELASSEGYHILALDYSVTGPLEVAVTFSSCVHNKTSVIQYNVSCGSMRSATQEIPTKTGSEPGDSATYYIALGAGGTGGLLVVVVGLFMLTVVLVRKGQSGREDSRYDAPDTGTPESDEPQVPPRDTVPHPVYEEIDTLQNKKEKVTPSAVHLYSVLEYQPQ